MHGPLPLQLSIIRPEPHPPPRPGLPPPRTAREQTGNGSLPSPSSRRYVLEIPNFVRVSLSLPLRSPPSTAFLRHSTRSAFPRGPSRDTLPNFPGLFPGVPSCKRRCMPVSRSIRPRWGSRGPSWRRQWRRRAHVRSGPSSNGPRPDGRPNPAEAHAASTQPDRGIDPPSRRGPRESHRGGTHPDPRIQRSFSENVNIGRYETRDITPRRRRTRL